MRQYDLFRIWAVTVCGFLLLSLLLPDNPLHRTMHQIIGTWLLAAPVLLLYRRIAFGRTRIALFMFAGGSALLASVLAAL